MPALVGPVALGNVNGGAVIFGDVLNISPKNTSRNASGAGADNIGLFVVTTNVASATNVMNTAAVDQPTFGNV